MRILVASGFEALSQWAHAINTVKMAQGFARLGHKVTVICRESPNGRASSEKIAKVYGLTEHFCWIQLPYKLLDYAVDEHWGFACLALPMTILKWPDMVFARNYILPWLTCKCGMATVAESHAHPDNTTPHFLRLVSAAKSRAFRVWITISHRLAQHYHSLGVPLEKLAVLPDAVDLSLFQRPNVSPASPYHSVAPNVVYTGHLYDYKGIPAILEAALKMPDVNFHLIGGWPEDIYRQQRRAQALNLKNVTFHGLKAHSEMPPYLWTADALLLPPSQHHPSAFWTSPLKLAEYLASGVPVVASAIPALRDWVTDEEVEFVPPDDPEGLAKGVRRVLSDRVRTEKLRSAALRKAKEFSYERRAEAILKRCGLDV